MTISSAKTVTSAIAVSTIFAPNIILESIILSLPITELAIS